MLNHNPLYRHARSAVDLIVNGAVRQIECQYADPSSDECRKAVDELIAHITEELSCWERDPADIA